MPRAVPARAARGVQFPGKDAPPMRPLRRRLVAASGIVALAGAVTATGIQWERSYADEQARDLTSQEAAASTVAFDCFNQPFFAPSDITLSCRNFRTALWDLDWEGWGGEEASSTGRYVVNECRRQACGEDDWSEYPVEVEIGRRQTKEGVSQYTSLTVTFPDVRPPDSDGSVLHFDLPLEP